MAEKFDKPLTMRENPRLSPLSPQRSVLGSTMSQIQ